MNARHIVHSVAKRMTKVVGDEGHTDGQRSTISDALGRAHPYLLPARNNDTVTTPITGSFAVWGDTSRLPIATATLAALEMQICLSRLASVRYKLDYENHAEIPTRVV